jgi:signal transduction histidine kinase
MTSRLTLRRELAAAFALVFACALVVMATGVFVIVSLVSASAQLAIYLSALVLADVVIFSLFGRYLLERRVIAPIEAMIDGIEKIAQGDLERRMPEAETAELTRLGNAVNQMAERLIAHQKQLAANIRSLDETNRMLTEATNAMVQAEKMASVGRLSAGIAHEVGNPLGAILGYLGLLGRGQDDSKRELVNAAEREAQRIDRIVRGLLEYARPRETKIHETDVNQVVHETLDLLRVQGTFDRTKLAVELEEDVPTVLADHYQLQQVLVNLLVNATDAMTDVRQPEIHIRTFSRRAVPKVHMPARRRDDPPGIDYSHRRRLAQPYGPSGEDPIADSGRVVEVIVSDNGSGIPRELLDQIFEPFVTTKEPGRGTGLGLAVCARLVEAMGGTIRADSVEGQGATFTILLPATVADPVRVGS